MQSGSLKKLLNECTDRFKFLEQIWIIKFLKKIYYTLLRYLTGLSVRVREDNSKTLQVNFNSFDNIGLKEPAFKELNPTYVMVKEKKIDYQVDIKNLDKLKINLPNFVCMEMINSKIRWINHNLSVLGIVRNYMLEIEAELLELSVENLVLTRPQVLNIGYDNIRLAEKVRVVEEIITMFPYIKESANNILFKIPITKIPLFKTYFSEDDMDDFRESLATQNKTKKTNVRILNIYDKFSVELFSSIKQEGNSKNLMCYLNNKLNNFDKNRLYYLIIGQRRDNKVTIKALARLKYN